MKLRKILATMAAFLVVACNPVPEGKLAQARVAGDGSFHFDLVEEKIREAEAGGYEYIGIPSTLVTTPLGGKGLHCERYVRRAGEQREGSHVRLKRRNRINLDPGENKFRFWINDAATGVECRNQGNGSSFVVIVLFSYRPSSLWSDGDELESLDVPVFW